MRVLLVSEWHPETPGGVQTHVRFLARELEKLGIEAYILSKGCVGCGRLSEKHIVVEESPITVAVVERIIESVAPDIVHSHHVFAQLPVQAIYAAHSLGVPSVVTNHTIPVLYRSVLLWKLMYTALYWKPLSLVDAVISVSRAADSFIKMLTPPETPRYVIPNGVDVEAYRPGQEDPEPTVLFVGRLVARKGPHILVKAFAEVVKEVKDAKLVIVGRGYMEPILKILIEKLGLSKSVKLLGYVTEEKKISEYRRSWVVATPSTFGESFCIVAIEAMACGKPVVASRVGGLQEIVIDGETGFLTEPRNARDIAEKLTLLLTDKKLRHTMGKRAREIAVERYSWRAVTLRILEVYKKILNSRKRF